MYPPRFNLRHFMSHLAPGGYCLLYILVFALFAFWLFIPTGTERALETLGSKAANSALISIAFVVFVVQSYFVGVVLRLPPVDFVDFVSIEYQLQKKLGYRNSPPEGTSRFANFARRLYAVKSRALDWFWPNGGSPLASAATTSQENPKTHETWFAGTQVAGQAPYLRDALRVIAADNLRAALDSKTGSLYNARIRPTTLRQQNNTESVIHTLWAVDCFPYPLWMTYKNLLQTGATRRKEFQQELWGIMLDSMRGDISPQRTSKGPFNRCKLYVLNRSALLAAEILDREALTRMMTGFYQGLRFASRGSLLAFFAVAVFWLSERIFAAVGTNMQNAWTFAHIEYWSGYSAIFFLSSFFFNMIMLHQVVANFHTLRMSESQAVFDSYLVVKQEDHSAG